MKNSIYILTLLSVTLITSLVSCTKDKVKRNDKIVMMGDSMTRRMNIFNDWKYSLSHDNTLNYGRDAYRTNSMIEIAFDSDLTLLDQVKKEEPRKVFLMAGVNDIHDNSVELGDILSNIITITNELQSIGTEVNIQSVLVGTQSYSNDLKEKSDSLNILLKGFCSERNINYIDLRPALLTDNGYLNEDFSVDGIHLNKMGYDKWVSTLKPYINF